jgi:hypothetical protein
VFEIGIIDKRLAFGDNEKIVFLNKENLAILEGYKATVKVKRGWACTGGEVQVLITGFSREAANRLFDELKPLCPTEIKGV